MRIAASLGLLLAVLTNASAEGRQPSTPLPTEADAVARQKAETAKKHFDRGEFDAAIEEYREAYRLVPTAGLLYNLGQAYRLAGRCAEAADAYRRFLAHSPDTVLRATVEQNLSASEVCARDAGMALTARAVPGVADPFAPEPEGHEHGATKRRAGLIVAAGGGVLLGASAYFAIDAGRAEDAVAEFYEQGGVWDDIAAEDARGRRSRTIAQVTLVTGIGAVATGATLYWLGRRADRQAVIAVAPRASGGEVVVSWGF